MQHEKHFSWINNTQNVMEKLFLDPVLKNQNWAYLWINSLAFYTVCFYCMPNWGSSKDIETLAVASYTAFLKNKKKSGTILPASFSAWLLKKKNSLVILY